MASGSTAGTDDDYEALISTTDVELLKRVWRNEKAAPEILRFETALIQRTRGQIQLMEETIEEFSSSGIDPLTVSLYQMDLDRTQYLLRSYLRTRLQKIGKYMFHISNNPEVQNRLSEQEKGFAKRCTEDMERHLEESVLSKLPDNYRDILKQSIISEENDMVPEPQLDTFVVCKSRRFLGPFQLDGSDELLEMKPDDLCIIHYKSIKERVQEGEIDLV
ncbi:DNA replication complex GINS protein SLD5 [Corylus avellana]|uniref:DNA replication complex GINS protein SLD5 n=1 Tax=Corylus avellana TaxID=13451 RepID=UPI00286B730F|nr:DNA replication complex GINS protein SLD5 [Corylus avellana]XP_059435214.1 DNA replication complex GINS protein SLD5 [Corylus avellana]XP_059435215.1 DNA replication complex GINS protein SLD5 [Corylus avellana]